MIENIISTRVQPCPKCGGSLANGVDSYGRYISCIMCGTHIDLEHGPIKTNSPATPEPIMMQADARDLYARTSHPTRNRTGGARRKDELPDRDLQHLILLMNRGPESQRTEPDAG